MNLYLNLMTRCDQNDRSPEMRSCFWFPQHAIGPGAIASTGFVWCLIVGLFFLFNPAIVLGTEEKIAEQVIYLRSGNDSFSAKLVPDQRSGSVPNDSTLVEATINDKSTTFQLARGQEGQLDLKGQLPGLGDGRHKGSIKTLTPDGRQKDRKQLLFIVDSVPPLIARVVPQGDLFPRTAASIQFRITDPENGSGISIDPAECHLVVSVNGAALQKSILSFQDNALSLFVFVSFPGGAAEHASNFTVSVSLQDRAGNVGRARETFSIRQLAAPVFGIYRCRYNDFFIQTAGEFLVEPSYSGLTLTAGTDKTIDFFTRGCFGKGFIYPEKVRDIIRRGQGIDKKGEPELVRLNPFFQETVGDLIDIQSTSENIVIRKLKDGDLADSKVSFRITQNNPVPMGDQVGALQVTIPVAFRTDPSRVNFCASNHQIDPNNEDDNVYHHVPEDAFIYTFETFTIPVFLEAAAEPVGLRVTQDDDQLTAHVSFSEIGLMDTNASWFAIEGEKYWFEPQERACVAKGPAREGMVHFKIAAAHKIAAFSGVKGDGVSHSRTMFNEGDIMVRLAPPVIENFRYDRGENTLRATLKDQGTPLGDLASELRLAGYRLEADFDPATGELTAVLPYTPVSILTASLAVTDLAEQSTTNTCQVFGEPASEEGEATEAGSKMRGPYTTTPSTRGIEKVLGTKGNGKALVEICDEVMTWGYYRNGRFVPIDHQPGALRLVQLRSRDSRNVFDSRMAISKSLPLHIEFFGKSYDATRYEPISQNAGGMTSLSLARGSNASATGPTLYYTVMARDGNRRIPIRNSGFGFGLPFRVKQIKECRVEERDILAPVIHPKFDPVTARLTASIHDHGMPLSELKIDLTAKSDSARNSAGWGYQHYSTGSRPAFSFQNGILISTFVPPPRGEFFTLQINAKDKAGNRSAVFLDIALPREPPEVSLDVATQETAQVLRRYGEQASTFITAEARDDSPIDAAKTALWLDDQVLRPITFYSHTAATGWRNLFNYKAGYVSGVEEGPHRVRFRATDATGLWAEATEAFDFRLAPTIRNFKVMPDALGRIGGPALTAMVIDQGGDLDASGLALTIDGQPVDSARLFYDASSGYFSVDGPLDLSDGSHVARITATDRHGNQASVSLRFTRAMEITTPFQSGGQGLAIDGLTLMELEDHNGDGRANPGELVRLFVSLHNDTDDLLVCAGRLSSEDLDILVEIDRVAYGGMEPGRTQVPMQGFEVRIDSDILDKTIDDPYEAYFDLTLGCDAGEEWVLPLAIPIYQPTIPINAEVELSLDRLPPTTSAGTLRLQGTITSSADFIDLMEIRVNGVLQGPVAFNREGGRFGATITLVDGANTIEVTGVDSNGVRGSAAGFIFRTTAFTPPSISITSPSDGDFFLCGNLTVTGTYNVGSKALSSIVVEAPWDMGICPVTIIDGTNFSVDCGDVISGPAGIYDIEATITTMDGFQAVEVITISVGDCS